MKKQAEITTRERNMAVVFRGEVDAFARIDRVVRPLMYAAYVVMLLVIVKGIVGHDHKQVLIGAVGMLSVAICRALFTLMILAGKLAQRVDGLDSEQYSFPAGPPDRQEGGR